MSITSFLHLKNNKQLNNPLKLHHHVPDGRSSRGSNRLLRISSLLRTSLTPKRDNFYVAVVAPRCREKTTTQKDWTGARENQSCLASKLEFMSSSSKFRISKEKRCDTIYYNTILLSLRKKLVLSSLPATNLLGVSHGVNLWQPITPLAISPKSQ